MPVIDAPHQLSDAVMLPLLHRPEIFRRRCGPPRITTRSWLQLLGNAIEYLADAVLEAVEDLHVIVIVDQMTAQLLELGLVAHTDPTAAGKISEMRCLKRIHYLRDR